MGDLQDLIRRLDRCKCELCQHHKRKYESELRATQKEKRTALDSQGEKEEHSEVQSK